MAGKQRYDQLCPVASGLDLIGGRWALLIVRELMLGPRRFTDIHAQLETASTDMVTNRLKALVDDDLIEKLPDRQYQLTPRGYALAPLIRAIVTWSIKVDAINPSAGGADNGAIARRLLGMSAIALRTTPLEPLVGRHQLRVGQRSATIAAVGHRHIVTEGTLDEASSEVGDGAGPASSVTFTEEGWIGFVLTGLATGEPAIPTDVILEGEAATDVVETIRSAFRSVHEDLSVAL